MAGTAFVLGGGGVLGAVEVGMAKALLERSIVPDLVVGTSVGALNGALLAAGPLEGVVGIVEGLNPTLIRLKLASYDDQPKPKEKAAKEPARAANAAPAT